MACPCEFDDECEDGIELCGPDKICVPASPVLRNPDLSFAPGASGPALPGSNLQNASERILGFFFLIIFEFDFFRQEVNITIYSIIIFVEYIFVYTIYSKVNNFPSKKCKNQKILMNFLPSKKQKY